DGYEDREFIESVSPLYHVNENSPPVLIVHGANDPIVPYEQSVLLYEKLKANNVKTKFVTIKEGLHGKFSKEERSIFIEKMWSFIGELGF
ncbi:MAG: prolyl oligopeptidase family serine peptidase, partial [Marinoscillum sp.]